MGTSAVSEPLNFFIIVIWCPALIFRVRNVSYSLRNETKQYSIRRPLWKSTNKYSHSITKFNKSIMYNFLQA